MSPVHTEAEPGGKPGTGTTGGEAVSAPAVHDGLDRRFHALSDPKRLRVLDLLRDGERCVCELTEALDVGQSLLSFHLKTLKEAGLVEDRRDGRWVYYSLAPAPLEGLRAFLGSLVRDGGEPDRERADPGVGDGCR